MEFRFLAGNASLVFEFTNALRPENTELDKIMDTANRWYSLPYMFNSKATLRALLLLIIHILLLKCIHIFASPCILY